MKELRPVLLEPPRRRLDPRLLQNRPDGAHGQLDPEPDQLALDPPVPPKTAGRAARCQARRRGSGTPLSRRCVFQLEVRDAMESRDPVKHLAGAFLVGRERSERRERELRLVQK